MLVGIRFANLTRYGSKRVGIFSGGAFNAFNGPYFGGVESGFASGFIGGFTFTKITWVTCSKCSIPTVRTRRDCIARGRSLGFVTKSTRASVTRGVSRHILKKSNDTSLALGSVQLIGKFSGIAWKTKLFALFVLVPSCGTCHAVSFNVDHVRVPSFRTVGAVPFGGTVEFNGGPCGLTTPC